jgi:uncharacterized RDD family membrane protein YckC
MGTPLYMAPEQARGEPVDFRADIYSLGAALHHMVAGTPPFQGDTPLAVISKHLSSPRPAFGKAGVTKPRPIDELCDRMMAKQPDDRFASYDDLIAAIENVSPVHNQPAGFWVRGFALALDVFFLLLLQIPAQLLGLDGGEEEFIPLLVAPLYAIVCHGRWGRTLGKAALEIEVVAADRAHAAGYRRAAKRFWYEWAPMYGAIVTTAVISATWRDVPDAVKYLLVGWLLFTMLLIPVHGAWTAWRDPRKRTFWDKKAGTQLRYRRRAA